MPTLGTDQQRGLFWIDRRCWHFQAPARLLLPQKTESQDLGSRSNELIRAEKKGSTLTRSFAPRLLGPGGVARRLFARAREPSGSTGTERFMAVRVFSRRLRCKRRPSMQAWTPLHMENTDQKHPHRPTATTPKTPFTDRWSHGATPRTPWRTTCVTEPGHPAQPPEPEPGPRSDLWSVGVILCAGRVRGLRGLRGLRGQPRGFLFSPFGRVRPSMP